MELCYITTPYRGQTPLDVEQNILNARKHAVRVMRESNYFPISPVLNTAFFEYYEKLTGKDDIFYLTGDLVLMERCDALFIPGTAWMKSKGCLREIHIGIQLARYARIKVFLDSFDKCLSLDELTKLETKVLQLGQELGLVFDSTT